MCQYILDSSILRQCRRSGNSSFILVSPCLCNDCYLVCNIKPFLVTSAWNEMKCQVFVEVDSVPDPLQAILYCLHNNDYTGIILQLRFVGFDGNENYTKLRQLRCTSTCHAAALAHFQRQGLKCTIAVMCLRLRS